MPEQKRKILFVAENATLAQVVRLKVLADSLPNTYEIHFACQSFPDLIFAESNFQRHQIFSVSKEHVLRTTQTGGRPYSKAILRKYIEEELQLYDEIRPDLVIGDLRLSLGISAPHRKIPYAALINAYWCKHWIHKQYPIPDHPTVKYLGPSIANVFYQMVRPLVFKHFANPINSLRKEFGLRPIGDLQEVLTYGDYTLHPDVPELVRVNPIAKHHYFLGDVPWSPNVAYPDWDSGSELPLVYVTLGSSGANEFLVPLLNQLLELPIQIAVSTAGERTLPIKHPNLRVAAYLPGSEMCRRADLVICNGGATTAYQAINAGTPVLGIPSNLDQYLSMTSITDSGAGRLLRTNQVSKSVVKTEVSRLLNRMEFKQAATKMQASFSRYSYKKRFLEFVESVPQ